jgi:ABC-type multidrug transport system fused ATPase/permease subunit
LREQIRLSLAGGSLTLIIGVVMALGTAAVLWLGSRHVQSGIITLGEFILLMSYLALLYSPLQTLSRSATSLQGSLVSLERAFSLLDEQSEVVDRPNAATLARAKGHIIFQNVSFSYGGDRPALR